MDAMLQLMQNTKEDEKFAIEQDSYALLALLFFKKNDLRVKQFSILKDFLLEEHFKTFWSENSKLFEGIIMNQEMFLIPCFKKQLNNTKWDGNKLMYCLEEIKTNKSKNADQHSENSSNDINVLNFNDNKIEKVIIYQILTTSMIRFIMRRYGKLPYIDYIQGNNTQYMFSMFPFTDYFNHKFVRRYETLAQLSITFFANPVTIEIRSFLMFGMKSLSIVGPVDYNPLSVTIPPSKSDAPNSVRLDPCY
ncbi:hypothetical protein HELRODRAFT_178036 [Helobdella robusta]|uniref:Uncharacterized protein n=1 Tax=Helobdella robusta TaxID=6412 RepID=T1FCN3_HELRO|nr:hypothetical protein HELRODRAFT_178036 [Helobdella robusta]ESN97600.1 hypothetical protein HELRODRAFT_178036 [Helobdella robusta]